MTIIHGFVCDGLSLSTKRRAGKTPESGFRPSQQNSDTAGKPRTCRFLGCLFHLHHSPSHCGHFPKPPFVGLPSSNISSAQKRGIAVQAQRRFKEKKEAPEHGRRKQSPPRSPTVPEKPQVEAGLFPVPAEEDPCKWLDGHAGRRDMETGVLIERSAMDNSRPATTARKPEWPVPTARVSVSETCQERESSTRFRSV